MKLRALSLVFFGWLIALLVGCGVAEQTDIRDLLILTPLPTAMTGGNCYNPSELENWLQTLVFNQAEFTNFLQNAHQQSRTQLFRLIQELNTVAITVASIPVLSCGELAYQLTVSAMQTTLGDFQAYINAQRHDLDQIILNAQMQFAQSQIEHDKLITLLEEMYRSNVNTP